MSETDNIRMERIQKLLYELKYEITRGIIEKEIDETIGFRFIVPISSKIPDGVVSCVFQTRPVHRVEVIGMELEPKLKIVK